MQFSLESVPTHCSSVLVLLLAAFVSGFPSPSRAQSVTFAGAQSTLPANGLEFPSDVVVDSAGDLFISDSGSNRIIELPRNGTTFGRQITLPFIGLDGPYGVAVDSAGDVFVADDYNFRVVEVPRVGAGYGAQVTLPFSGGQPFGVAVDRDKNVFVIAFSQTSPQINSPLVELPWNGSSYGSQISLPYVGSSPLGIAVDSAKNLFVSVPFSDIVELPWNGTGYGPQIAIPAKGLNYPWGLALDRNKNLYATLGADCGGCAVSTVELPRSGGSYDTVSPLALFGLSGPEGLGVDNAGNVYVAYAQSNRVVVAQTLTPDFDKVNVCPAGQRTPAPCSSTLPMYFTINANEILGTPQVLTNGDAGLDFTLFSSTNCTGPVTAGNTCTMNVTFAPQALGSRSGSVNIINAGGDVLATTTITGTGVPAGTLTPPTASSPAAHYFGTVMVGASVNKTLEVWNYGSGPSAGTLTLTPSIDAQSFKIIGNTCVGGIRSFHECLLQVQFSPVAAGSHKATLTLGSNAATDLTITLNGTGVPSL